MPRVKKNRRPVWAYLDDDVFDLFESVPNRQDWLNEILREALTGARQKLSVEELQIEQQRAQQAVDDLKSRTVEAEAHAAQLDAALQAKLSVKDYMEPAVQKAWLHALEVVREARENPGVALLRAQNQANLLTRLGRETTAEELLAKAVGTREEIG